MELGRHTQTPLSEEAHALLNVGPLARTWAQPRRLAYRAPLQDLLVTCLTDVWSAIRKASSIRYPAPVARRVGMRKQGEPRGAWKIAL
jgi:hypothetical protein